MPVSPDIDDFSILIKNRHSEADFTAELIDEFDCIYDEAAGGAGRIISISLHPWLIGQPYRIGALEDALDHMLSRAAVWSATGAEIMDAWAAQAAPATQASVGGNRAASPSATRKPQS